MAGSEWRAGHTPYRTGTSPQTRLVNTMRVRLFAPAQRKEGGAGSAKFLQVGTLQRWNPQDTRQVQAVRGIGYGDQIAELSVGVTELRGDAEIMALYARNMMQSFGYNGGASGLVRSLKHHRWPFDIHEEIWLPKFVDTDITDEIQQVAEGGKTGGSYRGSAATSFIQTIYEGCWMTNWGRQYQIGQAEVSESMQCMITDVFNKETVSDKQTAENFSDIGASGEDGIGNSSIFPQN